MSKDITLEKINEDIVNGNLGKARDRLHGLIKTYPNDLKLRSMLAEVYHKLQFPEMAGRYWYLEENKTDIMEKDCAEFEKRCGNDPMQIMIRLKFQGKDNELQSIYAKKKLMALKNRYTEKYCSSVKKGSKHLLRTFFILLASLAIIIFMAWLANH